MNSKRSTRETARFSVISDDGRRFDVVETSTFAQHLLQNGTWTPPLLDGKRYTAGAWPVNVNDDGSIDIVMDEMVRCRRA